MAKSMVRLLQDDTGIAWGLAAVFMMIVMGGAYYLFNLPIFNGLIRPLNDYIGQGLVSQQTADTASFGMNVVIFMPVVLLLGLFAWIVVRAHERRE